MNTFKQVKKKVFFFLSLLKQEKALTEKMYEYIKNRKNKHGTNTINSFCAFCIWRINKVEENRDINFDFYY